MSHWNPFSHGHTDTTPSCFVVLFVAGSQKHNTNKQTNTNHPQKGTETRPKQTQATETVVCCGWQATSVGFVLD